MTSPGPFRWLEECRVSVVVYPLPPEGVLTTFTFGCLADVAAKRCEIERYRVSRRLPACCYCSACYCAAARSMIESISRQQRWEGLFFCPACGFLRGIRIWHKRRCCRSVAIYSNGLLLLLYWSDNAWDWFEVFIRTLVCRSILGLWSRRRRLF